MNFKTVSLLLFITLMLISCTATQPQITTNGDLPGFWFGLWHGFISPVTFVISLFSETMAIYAFPNSGGWYNFGFMLGVGGFSGGIFAGSKR